MSHLLKRRISCRKPTTLFLASLIIVAALGVVACQKSTDLDQKNEEEAPAALHGIVYGKVDSIAPENIRNKVVLIMYHPNTKSVTEPNQMQWGRIKKSGKYKFLYAAQPASEKDPGYFTISVADYHKTTSDPRAPHSILAGPRKLQPKDLLSHFHPDPSAPLDSVRVDFTLPDSTSEGN